MGSLGVSHHESSRPARTLVQGSQSGYARPVDNATAGLPEAVSVLDGIRPTVSSCVIAVCG